jgi:hypothetical protein
MEWQWYNIIPARISLVSSIIVLLHISISFYVGVIHLKPFHITSILICSLDLIQDLGYAIPLPCPYAIGFLLFGCVSKAIIITAFFFYLYLLLFYQIINKDLLFWKFVIFSCLSFCIPISSLIILSLDGQYYNYLCQENNFATKIQSPVGYTSSGLIFLFTIIVPCSLGYLIFLYLIIFVIKKIGYQTISTRMTKDILLRFIFSLFIFTIAMIPGVYILILYIMNIQDDQIYQQAVEISGLCLCSLGFFYSLFYFSNISFSIHSWCCSLCDYDTTSQRIRNLEQPILETSKRNDERENLGTLLDQPMLSEPIIISESYLRRSSASAISSRPMIHSSVISQSLSSSTSHGGGVARGSLRQSELALVKISFHDEHDQCIHDSDLA